MKQLRDHSLRDVVVAAIRARSHSGRRLIVASASKSGPEVTLALTKLGSAETRHIAAWVNIVGALQGTPLADTRALPKIENKLGQMQKQYFLSNPQLLQAWGC